MKDIESKNANEIIEDMVYEDEVDISADEKYIEFQIEQEKAREKREVNLYDCMKQSDSLRGSFNDGIEDAIYYCGFYNTLITHGLSNIQAYEATMNRMNIIHAAKMRDMELQKSK